MFNRMNFYFCLIAVSAGPLLSQATTPLAAVEITNGFNSAVFVTSPPNDLNRLFIVEQTGRIRIYKNNAIQTPAFLDISGLLVNSGERGLLGLAFDPNYDSTGWFYVNYTRFSDGATVVARYTVSTNADSADENSAQIIITQSQPFSNHNAGMLAFSPIDGYLYFGLGDGGSGGDPGNRAQNPLTLLGKMLRLDVNGGIAGYTVPPDNPWNGAVDTLDEIWAFGLRNPWRYSFDRETGDLYIGDVGQNLWEEIDFQDSASNGGENYGWRRKEGDSCYNPSTNCDPDSVLDNPIHTYSHGGAPFRCSITGGYVYRGCAIPDLVGTYFFADFCSGQIWSFRYNNGMLTDFQERTGELNHADDSISSFGEDARGELYFTTLPGRLFKIVPDGVPSHCDCCIDRGNVDGLTGVGGPIDVADLTFLVAYLFQGGTAPPCAEQGNIDGIVGFGGPIDVARI